ncbi:MAG: hypothetical protein IPN87_17145 [Saprospiraceae bacterium]|nr:hypothetical protein [Candidatus Brachybacter algidus]
MLHNLHFTPTTGLCATTAMLAVTITAPTTPIFNAIPSQCAGGSTPLPNADNNGITGTWMPPFNPNASDTYTFTPTPGICATTTILAVTINPLL